MALDVIKQIKTERNRLQKELDQYKKKMAPLVQEIKNLDRALEALGNVSRKTKKQGIPAGRGKKRIKVKDAIVETIRGSGTQGIAAKDIIKSIGKDRQNTIRTTLSKMIKEGEVNYNNGKYLKKAA